MDTLKDQAEDQKQSSCESRDLGKLQVPTRPQTGYKDKLLQQNKELHNE